MKRKGISLIVLVITIVVIIILAAAVILSLGNNNPISNAKKAKVEQTMDTFKSDLSIQVANKLLNDSTLTVGDIDSRDEDEWRVTDLVPSIKGTEYENQLIVVDGKLKLKDVSTLPDTIQDIIKESLGEAVAGGNEEPIDGKYKITYNLNGGTATNVTEYTEETDTITLTNPIKAGYGFTGWTGSNGSIPQKTVKIEKGSTGNKTYTANWLAIEGTDVTKEMITSNPSAYIGKTVTYTGYSENTNTIDWRLFGLDKDGNIMLKANDYINLSYKKLDSTKVALGSTTNNYKIVGKSNRQNLIDYIGTEANWNEFAISGKTTARGAMTLPEFVYGYNLVNTEEIKVLECEYLTAGQKSSDNAITASADGYVIKKGTGSYSTSINGLTQTYSDMKFYDSVDSKAYGMWLTSASSYSASYLVYIGYSGYVYRNIYNDTYSGLCPAVSLTSGILVEKADGSLVVE